MDRATYGNLAGTKYGHSTRSANGKVLAIITALPGEDHEMGSFFRVDAEISIFDLSLDLECMYKIYSKGCASDVIKGRKVSSSIANPSNTFHLTKRLSLCIS